MTAKQSIRRSLEDLVAETSSDLGISKARTWECLASAMTRLTCFRELQYRIHQEHDPDFDTPGIDDP